MKRIESMKQMNHLLHDYYQELFATQKPVAWVTSGGPVEFLYAMDILPLYPENHAAMCGAYHRSLPLIQAAEAMGYSADICSYARTDFGADESGAGPMGRLPKPDLLLCSSNICRTVIKWYEAIARKYNCPLFMVDTPFLHDGPKPELIEYTVAQFHDLEDFLAAFCNRPFDHDAFRATVQRSIESSRYWLDTLGLARHRPSPINAHDMFTLLGPIVTLRGTEACREFYRTLYNEMEQRVRDGVGAIARERYRVLWDNLPVWFKVKSLTRFFEERGVALTVSTYTNSWGGLYRFDDFDKLYENLAQAYMSPYLNTGFDIRINYLETLINEYQLDGYILHSDRSCKPYSIGMYRMKEELTERSGKPGVILEADMNDPRAYAAAQIETRLEAFIEAMEAGRGVGAAAG